MLKIFSHPFFLIIFIIITIIFYISLSKTEQKLLLSSDNLENIAQETANLEQQNKILEEKIQNLDQEKIIRDELLMQKPGEYVVQIKDLPQEEVAASSLPSPKPWEEWKKLLF